MAAAVDSVAAVVVAESAIAGKRFTPSEQAKGAMKAWHPFFVCTDPPAMCHTVGEIVSGCEV